MISETSEPEQHGLPAGLANTLSVLGEWVLGGSTAIVGTGADIDIFLLPANLLRTTYALRAKGWEPSIDEDYQNSEFSSYRKGRYNIIMVKNEQLYYEKCAALRICQVLHKRGILSMEDKYLRVLIHEAASRGDAA